MSDKDFEEGRKIAQLLMVDQAALDAHIDRDAEWVRSRLLEDPREAFRPVVSMRVKREPHGAVETALGIIATEFAENQVAVMFAMGRKVHADRLFPVSVVLSSEVWTAPLGTTVEPRNSPDRRESVMCFGATLVERHGAVRQIDVTRGPGNVLVPLGTIEAGPPIVYPLLTAFFDGFFHANRAASAGAGARGTVN